jgi:phosphate transport system protein
MSRHLQRDMERMHREILSLSAEVEEMIDKATTALCERNDALAEEVIAADNLVDQREAACIAPAGGRRSPPSGHGIENK